MQKDLRDAEQQFIELSAQDIFAERVIESRLRLLKLYADLCIQNPEIVLKNELEVHFWKTIHYKTIDKFRKRKNPNLFQRFIMESCGFYNELIESLKRKYGSNNESSYFLVFTFYCYLGDLSRYKEQLLRNFEISREYYRTAAGMVPESGVPLNQLAIICSYEGNIQDAIYYYIRSFLSQKPFESAKNNMILLLQQKKPNDLLTSYFTDHLLGNERNSTDYSDAVSEILKKDHNRSSSLAHYRTKGPCKIGLYDIQSNFIPEKTEYTNDCFFRLRILITTIALFYFQKPKTTIILNLWQILLQNSSKSLSLEQKTEFAPPSVELILLRILCGWLENSEFFEWIPMQFQSFQSLVEILSLLSRYNSILQNNLKQRSKEERKKQNVVLAEDLELFGFEPLKKFIVQSKAPVLEWLCQKADTIRMMQLSHLLNNLKLKIESFLENATQPKGLLNSLNATSTIFQSNNKSTNPVGQEYHNSYWHSFSLLDACPIFANK